MMKPIKKQRKIRGRRNRGSALYKTVLNSEEEVLNRVIERQRQEAERQRQEDDQHLRVIRWATIQCNKHTGTCNCKKKVIRYTTTIQNSRCISCNSHTVQDGVCSNEYCELYE